MDALRKRIERAEAVVGSVDDFEPRLRSLAPRMGVDPDRMVKVAAGHRVALERELQHDGITWMGFVYMHDLLRAERPR
jgi:hypothetical protein